MKLKTPGSEGREKQDRVQSPLLPTALLGPTFLPFATAWARVRDTVQPPSTPLHPPPSAGRPEGLGTYHKVSAPAEHLGRHATVRAGGVLGVQDVTAKGTGWLVRPCPQPSCLPLPQVLSGSPGPFPTWAPTAPITRRFSGEPGSLNPCEGKQQPPLHRPEFFSYPFPNASLTHGPSPKAPVWLDGQGLRDRQAEPRTLEDSESHM